MAKGCDLANLIPTNCLLLPLSYIICDHLVGYCPRRRKTINSEDEQCRCLMRIKCLNTKMYKQIYALNFKLLTWKPTTVTFCASSNSDVQITTKVTYTRLVEYRKSGDSVCVNVDLKDFEPFESKRLNGAFLCSGEDLFASELTLQRLEKQQGGSLMGAKIRWKNTKYNDFAMDNCARFVHAQFEITWQELRNKLQIETSDCYVKCEFDVVEEEDDDFVKVEIRI
jgi:hypothetical protein